MTKSRSFTVHPLIDQAAAYSWRLIVIAAAATGVFFLIGRLWVVFLPLVLAAFITRVLTTPTAWLKRHRWRPGLAAAASLVGFLLVLSAVFGAIGVTIGNEAKSISPTVSSGIDDVETWLVTDAPGDLSRADIEKARKSATRAFNNVLRDSGGKIVSGAVVAFEVLLSIFLALIMTFFALKDGYRFGTWVLHQFPEEKQAHIVRLSNKAWATFGGYLKGAAMLGVVEGLVIGITLKLVGADLAVPLGALTFLMAFIPFAGAIVAGVLAVLVALATAGPTAAIIVAGVAIIVQQLDNDLLAPVIYGKALDLHPVVVLLSISAGGAMFGLPGTFLAVPITAIVMNVIADHRLAMREANGTMNGDSSDADDTVATVAVDLATPD